MRPDRRALLRGGLGAAAALAAVPALAQRGALRAPAALEVRAIPLDGFLAAEPGRTRFGALSFRAGFELRADHPAFGGFSGLWRSPDGTRLVAVTDNAAWLTAATTMRDGTLAGLADVRMAPILGPDGRPLQRTRSYDTEGLAIADGTAWVVVERSHEVFRFDWGRHGVLARGQPVPVPAEVKRLPRNAGLEAVGIVPDGAPLAGALVAIAERARPGDAPTRGFILTGPRRGAFDVVRSDGFDVTDLAFLPDGDLLLLERRYDMIRGAAVRLRRIAVGAVVPGAVVDGSILFEADTRHRIDNMEGLAVHQDRGTTVLTMISDDNFSPLQRTLLLEFALG
ncbi:MAG TPA: esterase-like activity of phytase family protein [Beijerinckiaceae bacterium]|nr:esterase-like activity of phytase family protein [Beijerinckiaceae bacterium]